MKEESITDALLREYLLGMVADEEQEQIENLFLTDPQTRERVFAIEQELIDAYLEDSLAEGDKERFSSLYAHTDEQRRKLRITKSIIDWAANEASRKAVPAGVSFWSRLGARLRLKPTFVVPIAVTLVIVAAILLLLSFIEQRRRFATQQELAQLNSPASLREVPPAMISLELSPVTVRTIEPQAEFKLSSNFRIVELRLPWVQRARYLRYEVKVTRVGGDTLFAIPNLQTENANVIRLRVPAHQLSRGHYQISLRGIADDGTLGHSEEYSFAVSE